MSKQREADTQCKFCHSICLWGHDNADECGWCGECHPEVPEWN